MAKSTLTPELLGQPARLVARSLGRLHLLKVLEEAARLVTEDDPEAVHDFRVALRRLRSWLEAFRPLLDDTVSGSSERRMRRLSRVAGDARDLQVQCESLRGIGESGNAALAREAHRIERRLGKEEGRARSKLLQKVVEDLPVSAAKLAAQLKQAERAPGGTPATEPTAAVAMAQLLAERLVEMESSLRRLKRPGHTELAHQARIATKRLRYLLEAFGSSSRLAATAALRLAEVQDEFGRLHDAQLLARRISRAKPVLRSRVRREIGASSREAFRLSRSRDIRNAEDATARLIRRLELRS
jgi:CHAD domain-containing protein